MSASGDSVLVLESEIGLSICCLVELELFLSGRIEVLSVSRPC